MLVFDTKIVVKLIYIHDTESKQVLENNAFSTLSKQAGEGNRTPSPLRKYVVIMLLWRVSCQVKFLCPLFSGTFRYICHS